MRPTLVGRYEVDAVLGRGRRATVFGAHDRRLGQPVAVKVLHAGAPACSPTPVPRLVHPHVVAVHRVAVCDGVAYAVLERLPGRTLADELARGPIDPRGMAAIAAQLLDGLAAAHARGLVHGSIGPTKVLLVADGAAKLGGFDGLGGVVGSAELPGPAHEAAVRADLAALRRCLADAIGASGTDAFAIGGGDLARAYT